MKIQVKITEKNFLSSPNDSFSSKGFQPGFLYSSDVLQENLNFPRGILDCFLLWVNLIPLWHKLSESIHFQLCALLRKLQ